MAEQSPKLIGHAMEWSVYIILCSDGSLYTGISTDVQRRFLQHQTGKGAKYFRSCQPANVVFLESGHSRGSASQREAEIKKMPRKEKWALIEMGGVPAEVKGIFRI